MIVFLGNKIMKQELEVGQYWRRFADSYPRVKITAIEGDSVFYQWFEMGQRKTAILSKFEFGGWFYTLVK